MRPPRVSVVMPTKNAAEHLAEAMNSILDQTFDDVELLIIDNGSGDETVSIANQIASSDDRVNVFEVGDIGLVAALNEGLARARGEYVARMDADDVSHRTRLAAQVEFLDQHRDYVLVGTGYRYVDPDGRPIGTRRVVTSDRGLRAEVHFGNPFGHPTVMLAPSRIGDALRYSSDHPVAEDLELWLRLLGVGKAANIAAPLLDHRVHPRASTQIHGRRSRQSAIDALVGRSRWPHAAKIYQATYDTPSETSWPGLLGGIWRLNGANARTRTCSRLALAARSVVAIGRKARAALGSS